MIEGTPLDKMEAIPGLTTGLSEDRFGEVVRDTGCAIVEPTCGCGVGGTVD